MRNRAESDQRDQAAPRRFSSFTIIAYVAVLSAGLLQAWVARHAMQSDGISYIDMGDAIVRGDWHMAANGYWSPLYPLLLGLALRILRPSAHWQFTVVHLVNFAIYAFAFFCFDQFLRALLMESAGDDRRGSPSRPDWPYFALGYLTFIWVTLRLITMERVTPDMLLAGFILLACAQSLRLCGLFGSVSGTRSYVSLGLILGVGYLAKAPLFPLAFVILAVTAVAGANRRRRFPGMCVALLVFLAVAGSYIALISSQKGRLIISESGRINFLVLMNHASPGWYFQNVGTGAGRFVHTARRIHSVPTIYEFGRPLKGTLPIWYDASYWTEGAVPRFALRPWLALVRTNLREYFSLTVRRQGILLAGLACLGLLSGAGIWRRLLSQWPLLIVVAAGLCMYGVIHVQDRYVAVFFLVLWSVWLWAVQTTARPRFPRAQTISSVAVVAALGLVLAFSLFRSLSHTPSSDIQWQAAEKLRSLGVPPGATVARVGGLYNAAWARLAGVTVIADLPAGADTRAFWSATPEAQAKIIEVFRDLGVKAVIAEEVRPSDVFRPGPEWKSLDGNTFYALVF